MAAERSSLSPQAKRQRTARSDAKWSAATAMWASSGGRAPGATSLDVQDRLIIALDLDAFYVAAARKRDPSLIGLPIGIQQKGLLATISYEARALGVRKLASISDAIKQCPEMILVNGEDLSYFRLVSSQVWRLVSGIVWGERVEKLGMDELFCDVTEMVDAHIASLRSAEYSAGQQRRHFDIRGNRDGAEGPSLRTLSRSSTGFDYAPWPALPRGHVLPAEAAQELSQMAPDEYQERLLVAAQLASYLRQQVSDKIGLTCSAGVAHSKMIAKLVGAMNKPNQQTTFAPRGSGRNPIASRLEQVQMLLDPLQLRQINGFGHVAAAKIYGALHGENQAKSGREDEARKKLTVGTTRKAASLTVMVELFGSKIGERLWSLANGIDSEPVISAPEFPLQISIEDTYPGIRGREIHDQILVLSESLLRRLEAELIKENRDASLDGIRHETLSSSQEVSAPTSAADGDMAAVSPEKLHVLVRRYCEVPASTGATAESSTAISRQSQTWLRYPLKVRLSVRQGWNSRVTKQAPMPVQIFDLSMPRSVRAQILYKACRSLLRALIRGDDVVGDSMNLINIAALELAEKRPTKAIESFFAPSVVASARAASVEDARRKPSSVAVPSEPDIDLAFVAALPAELRAEVLREQGLPTDTRLPAVAEPVNGPDGDSISHSQVKDVSSPLPLAPSASKERDSRGVDGELTCDYCGKSMLVWMQHDHGVWPESGMPTAEADGGDGFHDEVDGFSASDIEPHDLADRTETPPRAPEGVEIVSVDGDDQIATEACKVCGMEVASWMLLAHRRFHQLDSALGGEEE